MMKATASHHELLMMRDFNNDPTMLRSSLMFYLLSQYNT